MNRTQVAETHFNRATDCYHHGRYVQAIRHYRDGLEIDDTRAEIYADLSKSYEMVGRWDDALDCLEDALKLRPDYSIALRRMERVREEKQVFEALIRECNLHSEPPDDLLIEYKNDDSYPTIRREHFVLTYDATISLKTSWLLCQLIEQTFRDVGAILRCYPQQNVSVVLRDIKFRDTVENRSNMSDTAATLFPRWPAAQYDGYKQLTIYHYEDPDFGLLLAAIRHEWVHLLVRLLTHQHCGPWFIEGLAQVIARPLMTFERLTLREANRNKQLLSVQPLEQPFDNVSPNQRRLAFIQSTAVLEYLIEHLGISRIRRLLRPIVSATPPDIATHHLLNETGKKFVTVWKETLLMNESRLAKRQTAETIIATWKEVIYRGET